jgi:hypothetical protein
MRSARGGAHPRVFPISSHIWGVKVFSAVRLPAASRGGIVRRSNFRTRYCEGTGQGHSQSRAAAAPGQAEQSLYAGQGTVRPEDDTRRASDALHRLLFQRLPLGCRRVADKRRDLASDARFAQPQLGTSESRTVH